MKKVINLIYSLCGMKLNVLNLTIVVRNLIRILSKEYQLVREIKKENIFSLILNFIIVKRVSSSLDSVRDIMRKVVEV